jgi:RNase P subunit RPR2
MSDRATMAVQALVCQECRRPWLDGAERWRVYVTDDLERLTVPYCPECAHREFDPD